MYIFAVFIYFLCARQWAASLGLPNMDARRESLTSCILTISEKYFLKTDTISIIFSNSALSKNNTYPVAFDQQLLYTLYGYSAWTIFVRGHTAPSYFYTYVEHSDNYIIYIRYPADVKDSLSILTASSWNPQAQFVIVTTTLFVDPVTEMSAIAQTLWTFHILNAIILIPRLDDLSMFNIYVWFPYTANNCGTNYTESVVINKCRMGKLLDSVNLFPEKIPDNMNGCPVTVRTVIWPPFVMAKPDLDLTAENVAFTEGMEIKLMNTIAKWANLTVKYKISQKKEDFGDMLANGTATEGLLKELVEEHVDIGFASMAATKKRITYLDFTYPYSIETITWCVPIAALLPVWLSLIRILNVATWIATVFSFVTITLLIWRLSVHSPTEASPFQNFGSCWLYMFSTTLGMTAETLPKANAGRIVYLMWIVYSFHLCVAFQSSLVSKLTSPSYERQINTLPEVFEAQLAFGYLPSTVKYFEENSSAISAKVYSEGVMCDEAEECLTRIAVDRDFALALPRLFLLYMSRTYMDASGQSMLYWFKSNTVSYPVQMYMYKGFPLLNKLDALVCRIKAAGFINKWLDEAMMEYKVAKTLDASSVDSGVALKLAQLDAAFVILAIGLTLGTLSFIGELVTFRLKQKKFRKFRFK